MVENRLFDIDARGGDTKVYDYDGKIVKLRYAKIWYNCEGDYIEPTAVEINCLFAWLDNIFCP
jgi:hypothetical protein